MLAPADSFETEIPASEEDVRRRWLALQEAGILTPFQSLAWCERLHAGPGKAARAEPLPVFIRSAGRDIALLPLARMRREGLDVITFADFGLCDHAMPVIAGDAPDGPWLARAWPRLLEALPRADVLHFEKIVPALKGRENPLMALAPLREMPFGTWARELPRDWRDFEASLTRRHRRALRQRTARLGRLGETHLRILDSGEEAARAFATLRKMRARRFAALGRADALADDAVFSFYRDLLRDGAGGIGRIAILELEGEIVSIIFGLLHEQRFYMLAMSIREGDAELAKCSPGLVLVHEVMGELHKKGLETYDFTIGDEAYKRTFGAVRQPLFEHVEALSLKGRAWALRHSAKASARAMLRRAKGGVKAIKAWRPA